MDRSLKVAKGAYLEASAAIALLEVQVDTLYAYVSRGFIRSVRSPNGRGNLYSREDLERMRARRDARAGHGPVAGGALRWGEPVLDSRITFIDSRGPRYRGHLAVELADQGTSFEGVAELLWTSQLPSTRPAWPVEQPTPKTTRSIRALLADASSPLAAISLAAATISARDLARFGAPFSTELQRARSLVARLACAAAIALDPSRHDAALAEPTIARKLSRAFGARSIRTASAAIEKALIVVADHELNVSTFAARIAASAGADLYACVSAALAALSGPKHGGATDRAEALVAEIGDPSNAADFVHARTRAGESIPGFGHRLYEGVDPRGELLLDLARSIDRRARGVRVVQALARVMTDEGREPLNIDCGLAALVSALGLPRGSGVAIFAVGRVAGWIAHAFEQREDPSLLRPRARYVGP